jgi:hypothetical protein
MQMPFQVNKQSNEKWILYLCYFQIDADKQDAINLFLGNFVTKDNQPMLWELSSDYHLHNQDPRNKATRRE